MKRVAPIILLLLATGCARMVRSMIGREDPDAVAVRIAAAPVLNCPVAQIALPVEDEASRGFDWTARGCERTAACRPVHNSYECFPVPIPWWASSPADLVLTVTKLASDTRCPAEKADIKAVEGYAAINLCGREFACSRERCEESAESVDRTARKSAIDRLALETNCPMEKIQLQKQLGNIYRLGACGKDYVCTTASGRLECRLALDHDGAVAAPL